LSVALRVMGRQLSSGSERNEELVKTLGPRGGKKAGEAWKHDAAKGLRRPTSSRCYTAGKRSDRSDHGEGGSKRNKLESLGPEGEIGPLFANEDEPGLSAKSVSMLQPQQLKKPSKREKCCRGLFPRRRDARVGTGTIGPRIAQSGRGRGIKGRRGAVGTVWGRRTHLC